MQTYIVLGLVALAAGYVIYMLLRRFGLLGAPLGCGCGCESGCASSGPVNQVERELSVSGQRQSPPQAVEARQGCHGCVSTGGCCQAKSRFENNEQG